MKVSIAKTEELLCEVYCNLRMGSENLCGITSNVSDKLMLRDITGQIESYAEYTGRCENIMRGLGIMPKEPSAVKKLISKGGLMLSTMGNTDNRHVAYMIASGTDTGADKLEQTMQACRRNGCSEEAAAFCADVIGFERRASDEMKGYF